MSRKVPAGAASLWAIVTLIDENGAKAAGVLPAAVSLYYQVEGEAPVGPLALVASGSPAYASLKWYELEGGDYRAGLPAALAAVDKIASVIRVYGTFSGGDLHSETLVVDATVASRASQASVNALAAAGGPVGPGSGTGSSTGFSIAATQGWESETSVTVHGSDGTVRTNEAGDVYKFYVSRNDRAPTLSLTATPNANGSSVVGTIGETAVVVTIGAADVSALTAGIWDAELAVEVSGERVASMRGVLSVRSDPEA